MASSKGTETSTSKLSQRTVPDLWKIIKKQNLPPPTQGSGVNGRIRKIDLIKTIRGHSSRPKIKTSTPTRSQLQKMTRKQLEKMMRDQNISPPSFGKGKGVNVLKKDLIETILSSNLSSEFEKLSISSKDRKRAQRDAFRACVITS